MSCDVLVPVYDTPPDTLRRSLDSALAMEGVGSVLVYNDASTSKLTLDALAEYASKPGITIFNGRVNQGPGYGRNFLMRRSEAKYVLFQDADDISHVNRILVMVKAMEEKDEQPVLMTSEFKPAVDGPRATPTWGDYTVTRRFLEHTFPLRFAGAIIRREEIINAGVWWPQGVRLNDDVLFVQRTIAAFPFRVNFRNEVLWEATAPAGNLTSLAHPKYPRSTWTKPTHFYLHHAMASHLSSWAHRHGAFQAGKWDKRIKEELTSVYHRFVLGFEPLRGGGLNGAPPNAFTDPAETTNKAGKGPREEVSVEVDLSAGNSPGVRPGDGAIIYFGHDIKEHHNWIRPWAERLGKPYEFIKIDADFYRKAAPRLKRASFVVIWNGCQSNARNATALCENMRVPTAYFEWGVQPQKETFLVDLKGMVNRSMLMEALGWVTDADIEAFDAAMAPLKEKYPLEPKRGRILVPMQIENDTQVIYSSSIRNMAELVEMAETIYPNHDIVVRPHPKSGNQFNFKSQRGCNIIVESKKECPDFLDAARVSDVVIGLNSTSLVEAAMIGCNTVALGDCPLRAQPLRHRHRLLAGYWALRCPRKGCISDVLDRFTIAPID